MKQSRPKSLISRLGWARHRLALAYRVRCAREDARVRHVMVPLGVWVCQHCPHVSLDLPAFDAHLVALHA
jgi:hypothetical protein